MDRLDGFGARFISAGRRLENKTGRFDFLLFRRIEEDHKSVGVYVLDALNGMRYLRSTLHLRCNNQTWIRNDRRLNKNDIITEIVLLH